VAEDSGIPSKAAHMLQEEILERTGIRLPITVGNPTGTGATIQLLRMDQVPKGLKTSEVPKKPEGFAIWTEGSKVYCVGHDDRGVLFATGRLLRLLTLEERSIQLDSETSLSTAPKYPIRGHQIGYRNTANTYDAWDIDTYEQYIRDLIVFGTNSIELITALDPEERDGPVMTESQWEMNLALVELVHSYGLDVWFWMSLDGDVTDPKVAQDELDARDRFFSQCVAIDHIMVPGGDPGRTTPSVLMPWLEKMAGVLHRHFPEAGVWVSNQKFKPEENDVFFRYLEEKQPDWLRGVAYGPGTLITLQETRDRTPEKFQLRRYPDITHCVRCQYPAPEWDGIFAQTLGREPTNPRPSDTSHIHNVWAHLSDGFVSYSDGAHDDLNKMLWSALAWDPEAKVDNLLEEYGRLFFGTAYARDVAQGLRNLEENWRGPILENANIEKTLNRWVEIESESGGALESNWRFQLYLMRAYFDAYIQARHRAEVEYQKEAYDNLGKASEWGTVKAIALAREALSQTDTSHPHPEWRSRIEELAVDLFQSIGFQWSVDPPYLARNPERGALLDKVDRPLNDRPWLEERFDRILTLDTEEEKLLEIQKILEWDHPGEGGF
ncbi:MAG: hypothetical protein KC978_19945, partial [Candidatus Omnitrophica bacterium]|nr:hypothetical protein [Candidatus Omnitrophota bacterium]